MKRIALILLVALATPAFAFDWNAFTLESVSNLINRGFYEGGLDNLRTYSHGYAAVNIQLSGQHIESVMLLLNDTDAPFQEVLVDMNWIDDWFAVLLPEWGYGAARVHFLLNIPLLCTKAGTTFFSTTFDNRLIECVPAQGYAGTGWVTIKNPRARETHEP